MNLREILTPDCTKCAVDDTSKKKLLESISHMVAPKLGGVSRDDVFESLLQRERLGSTGIGLGIAIPHGRLTNASHPVAVLITLSAPIEFESIDNQRVDIISCAVFWVARNMNLETHLSDTLSWISLPAPLNNRECCRKLRSGKLATIESI